MAMVSRRQNATLLTTSARTRLASIRNGALSCVVPYVRKPIDCATAAARAGPAIASTIATLTGTDAVTPVVDTTPRSAM
jgi:hypothetical protein